MPSSSSGLNRDQEVRVPRTRRQADSIVLSERGKGKEEGSAVGLAVRHTGRRSGGLVEAARSTAGRRVGSR